MTEPGAGVRETPGADRTPGRSRRVRLVRAVIGAGLLVAAIVAVWLGRERLVAAGDALRDPAPIPSAGILLAVAANLVLTGLFFHALLGPHVRIGRLGRGEMVAVMSGASLLNYLPLRPGLPARLAYHRAVHGIPLRASSLVLVQAIALSAAAAIALVLLTHLSGTNTALLTGLLGGLAVALAVATRVRAARPWPAAALIRLVEIGCIALRSAAAFALVGVRIGPAAATAFAAVAVIATMIPLTSNGLGLREWATGLVAPVIADVPMEVAVLADLVARAAELLVTAIAGSIALAHLGRRMPADVSRSDRSPDPRR